MTTKRFFYRYSTIYGWTVYDRRDNLPAYYACCEELDPISIEPDGTRVVQDPTQLKSEYAALRLCSKLNRECESL